MRNLLVVLALVALVAPGVGHTQSPTPQKIGYLSVTAPPQTAYLDALRKGLRDHGWSEGQNLSVEYRWAAGKADLLPDLAASWCVSMLR
jgi:putative ABC transport system substrate-binding protein